MWDGHGDKVKVGAKDFQGGGVLRLGFRRQDPAAIAAGYLPVASSPYNRAASKADSDDGDDGTKKLLGRANAPQTFARRWVVRTLEARGGWGGGGGALGRF